MNTLTPTRNSLPPSRVNPIVSAYVKTWPRPAGTVPPPDRSDSVRYGEYPARELKAAIEWVRNPLVYEDLAETAK
jgi:hypothetical protein